MQFTLSSTYIAVTLASLFTATRIVVAQQYSPDMPKSPEVPALAPSKAGPSTPPVTPTPSLASPISKPGSGVLPSQPSSAAKSGSPPQPAGSAAKSGSQPQPAGSAAKSGSPPQPAGSAAKSGSPPQPAGSAAKSGSPPQPSSAAKSGSPPQPSSAAKSGSPPQPAGSAANSTSIAVTAIATVQRAGNSTLPNPVTSKITQTTTTCTTAPPKPTNKTDGSASTRPPSSKDILDINGASSQFKLGAAVFVWSVGVLFL